MKIPSFAEISIYIVNRIFHWRFWIAQTTRKSNIMYKIIDNLLFKDDDVAIIPNSKKININKTINSEGSEFLPSDVIKEVIKKCDDIVIMNSCLCRTSSDCKDYPQDLGCIFLGPTSNKIPEAISHKATVEEALHHVDLANKAGLSHIIGRNKIDSVWMNIGPRKGLLTICHCCPCCCLWKVYPNLATPIQERIYKLPGVEIKLNNDKCTLCKKCLKSICYSNAIELKEDKININQEKCLGCGHCANICKQKAITITFTEESVNNVIERCYNLIEE